MSRLAETARIVVDESFVPCPKPSVASVELDGERVLYDTATGQLLQLDVVGSLVWACFDGKSDVRELSADLAHGFAIDVQRVRAEVTELVSALLEKSLLSVPDGVEAQESEREAGDGVSRNPRFLVDPPGG